MHEQRTVVESAIEREVRECLRSSDVYLRSDEERRRRIENSVREAIQTGRAEDEI